MRTALALIILCLATLQVADAKTLSQRVYKQLTAVHELRDEGRHAEAMAETRELLESARLNDFERAQTQLVLVDLLLGQDRYADAVPVIEDVLRGGALSRDRAADVRLTLAQLYQQLGRTREALRLLETWITTAAEVPARVYFLLAVLALELEQEADALRYADAGRKAATELTQAQYELLSVIYYRNSKWEDLEVILVEALARFPQRTQFWTQLVHLHLEQKREREALTVLRLADKQGALIRGSDLIRMAQLMRLHDTPWLAAQVLTDGFAAGRIKPTPNNHLLLGESWMAARENDAAYPWLHKVAEATQKPSDWLRLAQLYAQDTRWDDCLSSARSGLKQPDEPKYEKDIGKLHIMAGVCLYEQDDLAGARVAFTAAEKHKNTEKMARSWLQATAE